MFKNGMRKGLKKQSTPEEVLAKLEPGMSIFVGTGVAEPRTLLQCLMESNRPNLVDLEIIQLVSLGGALDPKTHHSGKLRLKTFYSGWVAGEPIRQGQVDMIPSRISRVPLLIQQGRLRMDAVFVQISPPDESGYVSLGVAVDVAKSAMYRARLVVGEINCETPRTMGDTFVHMSEFDYLVNSTHPLHYFDPVPVKDAFDRVAQNVARIIEDGSCLAFAVGPLYDALAARLTKKKDLNIHSFFITDALMNLIKSGAVTNRRKPHYRGKSVCSYAMGSKELMRWLDNNPLVEFQRVDEVFNPVNIGAIPNFMAVFPARRMDLTGTAVLPHGGGHVSSEPGHVMDFFNGAEISPGGRTIFALPSRNKYGRPNIRISVEGMPNQFSLRESVDLVVTDFGTAVLFGRSVRERAQALIDVAHPEDRAELFELAKEKNLIYRDQIFLADSAVFFPSHISLSHALQNGKTVRIRGLRPSDEEEMRRLFYRFSEEAVYYRYFSPIKSMPHTQLQKYVNVDYRKVVSLVALVGEPGSGHIVAEARLAKEEDNGTEADLAFVVDESFRGQGLAGFLLDILVTEAKKQGIKKLTADVLASNRPMLRVFEKSGLSAKAEMTEGEYMVTINLEETAM